MLENISSYLQSVSVFSLPMLAILIGVGFVVGFVNTVAGGATAITYMLFMAMGMPINIANATSRVGVLLQFITSSVIFKREGYLNLKEATKISLPTMFGSIFGALLAAKINPQIFEVILAFFLCFMLFFMFYDNKKFLEGQPLKRAEKFSIFKWLVFFVIGFYGGFSHIGVGILLLFGSVYLVGMNMFEANTVKQYAVMLYTPMALIVFAFYGQIKWDVGLIYAVGNVAGAFVASKTAIRWGAKFIRWCVAVVVVIFITHLILKNI